MANIDIIAQCNLCGGFLDILGLEHGRHSFTQLKLRINPCKRCIEEEKEDKGNRYEELKDALEDRIKDAKRLEENKDGQP